MEAYKEPAHEFLVLITHALSCSINMHGLLSSGATCLYFGLNLYLHHSLCVRAVKALAMLRTILCVSEY